MHPRLVGVAQTLTIHFHEVQTRGSKDVVDDVGGVHVETLPTAVEVILEGAQRYLFLPKRQRDQHAFDLKLPTGMAGGLVAVTYAARKGENQSKPDVFIEQDDRFRVHLAPGTEA